MSLQDEELEVLESIYGDDSCFQKISNSKFHYRYGDQSSFKSFILEIEWGANYPEESPVINLDLFYNQHTNENFKTALFDRLSDIAQQELGNPVTYILFEHIREHLDEYLELISIDSRESTKVDSLQVKKVKVKHEQLTKSQKRKQLNKLDENGQIPRGSDWVNVLRHLQQVGSQT